MISSIPQTPAAHFTFSGKGAIAVEDYVRNHAETRLHGGNFSYNAAVEYYREGNYQYNSAPIGRERFHQATHCDRPINSSPESRFLKMAAAYLPKDDPKKPRGEDAHFICSQEQTFGIADGVGGWNDQGIDPGEYSRELMKNSLLATQSKPKGIRNPRKILQEAYSNTKTKGSSTACIITLNGNLLHAANVGDSGFLLIRDGKVTFKSPIQQHSFGCPYQLGNTKDNPNVAEEIEVMITKGDIVVAGTDGLFDNMDNAEIEEALKRDEKESIEPKEQAQHIANLALYNSFDRFADTPYARAARRTGRSHRGGKIDDITVIVAHIH